MARIDPDIILNQVGDVNLTEELRSFQQFLVDSQLEWARYKLFIYAKENLSTTIVDEKLDHFLNNLNCPEELNLAFGFILKNLEDGGFS